MNIPRIRLSHAALIAAMIGLCTGTNASDAQTAGSRIEDALRNITALLRPGRVGYATFWDGNKYVQCRRMHDRMLRCEAAGTSMQPSLKNVLTGDRLNRLAALGWMLDPHFGNYVHIFAPDLPTARVADQILRVLTEAYAANAADLETKTDWIADMPCPPRNGPSQNLAGIVNDAPAMQPTAVHACSYTPAPTTPRTAGSAAELIALYGARVAAEIQRLRINAARHVFVIFGAGIGYVQCMPETPDPALYCKAQSAESWAALATVLTPERVSRLHSAGYADPGRAPNYWKRYPFDKFSDATIASEILTVLYDGYGYAGAMKLKISTE